MTAVRLPYTLEEDRNILEYIMQNHRVQKIKGIQLWQEMETKNVCPGRTWQSMKNRFLRNICKDLGRPELGLDVNDKALLKLHVAPQNSIWQLPTSDGTNSEAVSTNADNDECAVTITKPLHNGGDSKNVAGKTEFQVTTDKLPPGFYDLTFDWSDTDSD